MAKIIQITADCIHFDNGYNLSSSHNQDCCEHHYLDFTHINKEDYEGLEFDIPSDDFFERISDYGIALKATNNFPLRIPGYASNNGYYSRNLSLVLTNGKHTRDFDITECQEDTGY